MSEYYDEHDCEPLMPGEGPNYLIQMARLLVDTGYWSEAEFSAIFSGQAPPATSQSFMKQLQSRAVKEGSADAEFECAICLKKSEQGDLFFQLPCHHKFHQQCVLPWLSKTSSCPVCRFQLPTDNDEFEEMIRQKKRQADRAKDVENLHATMFS